MLDEPHGKVPQLLEIVAGVVHVGPFIAEPADVLLNAFDVLCVLLLRVGVVEAQVANAAIALSYAKVHCDGLSVSDVQVTIRFGREASLNFSSVFPLG